MAVLGFSETKGTLFYKLSVNLGILGTGFLPILKATKRSDMYPQYNRLSDMTTDGKGLVGITRIFKDVSNSYSELVSLNLKDGKYETIGSLCLDDCADNWEGLLRFNDGWLVLSDNKFDDTVKTRLTFSVIKRLPPNQRPRLSLPVMHNPSERKSNKRFPEEIRIGTPFGRTV